jgi:uncharacterized protein VirK/YbjX
MTTLTPLNSASPKVFYQNMLAVARINHPSVGLKSLKNRVKFLLAARRYQVELTQFSDRMARIDVSVTQQMLGVLEWPYIHNEWDVPTKLDKIATHYEILSQICPPLTKVNQSQMVEIMDLSHIAQDVKVLIDYAPWFIREGELVINIFQKDLRTATLAFSLAKEGERTVAYIGAVQGIHSGVPTDESLEIYRVLTKMFEGLRPRTLLLEVLKVMLVRLGVNNLYAISEQHRHHRHRYFGNDANTVFKADYNSFWEEHDGELNAVSGFYELPMAMAMKDMSEIPSKKRSMYKRRYEIMESFKNLIHLPK